jgi:hypothetical protein
MSTGIPAWPYVVQLSPYSNNPSWSFVSPRSGVPDFSAKWTITAPSTPGEYVYTIVASSQGKVKTATFRLNVQQPQPQPSGFTLSVSPSYVEAEVCEEPQGQQEDL